MKQRKCPEFSIRLNQLRGEDTIDAFSRKIGITRQTLGFYLSGDRVPDIVTLRRIAESCGVSADWLIGVSDSRSLDVTQRAIVDTTGLSEKALQNLTDNDWWCEQLGPDGATLRNGYGYPLRFPHDGLSVASVVSALLEDKEFVQIIGNLSRHTSSRVREARAQYDASAPSCDDESDGIRVNPMMRPFNDRAHDIVVHTCAMHFGNVVERFITNYRG